MANNGIHADPKSLAAFGTGDARLVDSSIDGDENETICIKCKS